MDAKRRERDVAGHPDPMPDAGLHDKSHAGLERYGLGTVSVQLFFKEIDWERAQK